MRKFLRLSCTPCMILGVILFIYSTNAMAQDDATVSYKWLLGSVLGAFGIITGAYIKGIRDGIHKDHTRLQKDVDDIDTLIHTIDRRVLMEYPSKIDMRAIISSELRPIRNEIRVIKKLLKLPQDEREESEE